MRREWIEIQSVHKTNTKNTRSPSMRREWIEMPELVKRSLTLSMSPSMRREWIEMRQKCIYTIFHRVSLHAEGVD